MKLHLDKDYNVITAEDAVLEAREMIQTVKEMYKIQEEKHYDDHFKQKIVNNSDFESCGSE